MDKTKKDPSNQDAQYANWLILGSLAVALFVILTFVALRLYIG
jgi:hypothetical protein